MDHNHYSSNYNSNQGTQPSGFRKLDLGSGSSMMMSSAFAQPTQATTNNFQSTTGLNEDINQRTLSFGQNATNVFNPNGTGPQQQLNQSMDCQSSMMSTKGAYQSPRNNHQPQIPSLISKGQQPNYQLNSQNYTQNQHYYPSSTSSLASCRGSEYFPTPQRSNHHVPQASAFNYQGNAKSSHNNSNSHSFQFQRVLFTIRVPFRVRSQGRDEFTQDLEVKMVLHAQSSNNSEQHLTLEITDEQNPYFLYSLDCSEKDYHIIKNDQSLIADFQQFPDMFKTLIDRCLGEDIYSHQPCPYYCMLILSQSNEASFKIIEQNAFKALAHLTLIVKSGNDESIKKYLAAKLKETKESLDQTSSQLKSLEENFHKLSSTNENITMELTMSREECRRIADHMKIEEQKKINEIREKMLLEQSEMTARYDNEKREILAKFEKQVRELQEEVSIKRDIEIENKEQKQCIDKLSYELDLVKNELTELRSANKGLDQTKFSQEKSLTEYMLKYQSLERELQDKQKMIENLQNHVETMKSEKSLVEQTLASQKAKNEKMENKINDMVAEIKKAQGIIDKQQSKAKTYKQKIKLNTATSKQYEQALQQRQDQIDEQNKMINDMKKDFDRKETELSQNYQSKLMDNQKYIMQLEGSSKDLKQENEQLTQKLNESKSTIESNQATIVYLNQRLSEKGGLGGMSAVSKPPPAAGCSFKPTFASIEQLQGGGHQTSTYKSGSPYRNFSQNSNHLNTPGSTNSLNTSTAHSYNPTTSASITLKNQAPNKGSAAQSSTFSYPLPKPANNENVTNNIPSQPQFVSKYTQQLYQQQQSALPSNPLPMDSKNSSAFKSNLARNNSNSSLNSSEVSSHFSSQQTYELKNFSTQKAKNDQMATMSFNPYNQTFAMDKKEDEEQEETLKVKMEKMSVIENQKPEAENNESKMSNNEAFLAFLSKNEGSDDEE